MDLNQLTKKNQEFIHIATNQLIRDGKSDEEIKAILADVLPTIVENQKKGLPPVHFLAHQQLGLLLSQHKNQKPKTLTKRKTITLG